MQIRQYKVGGDRNFSYLIIDEATNKAAVVDPAFDLFGFFSDVEEEGLKLETVLNTHGDEDHTNGNDEVQVKFGAHIEDEYPDGKIIKVGSLDVKAIATPGHTPDSVCFHVGNNLITGDTLFVGKIGGTPDRKSAKTQQKSLQKIVKLPDDTIVWPGHDFGAKKQSTIGEEKKNNPFLKRLNDFEKFWWLKQHWSQYKQRHGIA